MAQKTYDKTILQTSFTSLESIYYLLKAVKDNQPMTHSAGTDVVFPQARARVSQARGGEWDEGKRDTHAELTLKEMNFIRYTDVEENTFEVSDLGNTFLQSFELTESPVDDGKVTLSIKAKIPDDQKNMLLFDILSRIVVKQDNYGRNIHPYIILFKLLSEPKLGGYISKQEWACFINDSSYLLDSQYNDIFERILEFRKNREDCDFKKSDRILTRLVLWGVLDKLDSPEGDSSIYFAISTKFHSALENFMVIGGNLGNPQKNLNMKNNENELGLSTIYFGAPGTGKSYKIKHELIPDGIEPYRVTFYPDYYYTDFVGGLRPKKGDNGIEYEFEEGPFAKALKDSFFGPTYLIIEEINRGNAAAIFGDVFQLLDRENGKSVYSITNKDLYDYLVKKGGVTELEKDKIYLPANLNILCTMNTADQNVFVLDTAFKRRFNMVYVPIDFNAYYVDGDVNGEVKEKCKGYIENTEIFKGNGYEEDLKVVMTPELHESVKKIVGDPSRNWRTFAAYVNAKIDSINSIEPKISEDKKLGPFFVDPEELKSRQAFADKVIYYLKQDVFKYEDNILVDSYETLYNDFVKNNKDIFEIFQNPR